MSNQGKGPSFKTDVNRNPTKKWTTAASYSYDGGDWDGYDEYDDTPPAPKPTGLRQKGQASVDATRNFTAPEASNAAAAAAAARARANSFEPGDERRTFSSGHASMPVAPTDSGLRQSTAPQAARGPINSYPPPVSLQTNLPPSSVAPHIRQQRQGTGTSSRQSSTTDSPSVYSAATVASLADRGVTGASPVDMFASPVSASADGVSSALLASRSNLSQSQTSPSAQYIAELDAGPNGSAPPPPPGAESAATEEHVPKAFIRPADIYKRLDQEREKERRSSESSRPSVDSTGRPTSRQLDSGQRKSSSPMRNVITVPTSHEATHPATYSTYELPDQTFGAPAGQPHADASRGAQMPLPVESTETYADSEATASPSEAPKLPNLLRFSGFGLGPEMMWPTTSSEAPPPIPAAIAASAAATSEQPLKHQSSTGFRSAVNEAFEAGNDNLLTPASVRGSQRSVGESEYSALGSNSTSGVSPIMSSVPTGLSTSFTRDHAPGSSSTPTIPEDAGESSPPPASGHDRNSASISTIKGTEWGQERGHARVTSGDSTRTAVGPTSGTSQSIALNTVKSPARSADVRNSGEITAASVAQIRNVASFDGSSEFTDTEALAPRHDLATREADVATAVNSSNDQQTPTDADHSERRPRSRESSVASWASSRERSRSPQKFHDTATHGDAGTDEALAAGAAAGAVGAAALATGLHHSSETTEASSSNAMPGFDPASPSAHTDEDASMNEENDQLTSDIMHSLTPGATEYTVPPPPPIPESPTYRGGARESTMSTILPREYESYWAADSPTSPVDSSSRQDSPMVSKFPPDAMEQDTLTTVSSAEQRGTQLTDPAAQFHEAPRPGMLDRKFSWEDAAEDATTSPAVPIANAPDTQQNARESENSQPRPTAEPSHSSFARGSSEFAELDAEQARHFEGPDGERIEMVHTSASFGPSVSPTAYELGGFNKDSSNSLMDVPPKPHNDFDRASVNSSEQGFEDAPTEQLGAGSALPSAPVPTFTFAPPVQAMGFREIVAIKKTGDRIDMFNTARSQHATADSGLENWMGYMIHHNPSFGNIPPSPKVVGSPTSGAAGGAGGSPTGATPGRSSTLAVRASSAQMSAKGKDLLHSAGVFGGKATHGAKGLFAKGKSKLRAVSSEKVRIGNRSISNPPETFPSSSSAPYSAASNTSYTLTPSTSAGPSLQFPPPPYDPLRPPLQASNKDEKNTPSLPPIPNAPLGFHEEVNFTHQDPGDQPIDDDRSFISGDDRPPVPPKSLLDARASTFSHSPTLVPSMDETAQSYLYSSHSPNKSVSRPVSQVHSHDEHEDRSYLLQQSVGSETRGDLSYTSSHEFRSANNEGDTLAPHSGYLGPVSPISPMDYTPTSLFPATFSPQFTVSPQLPPADINSRDLNDERELQDEQAIPSVEHPQSLNASDEPESTVTTDKSTTMLTPIIIEPTDADLTAASTTEDQYFDPLTRLEDSIPPSHAPLYSAQDTPSSSDSAFPEDVKHILGLNAPINDPSSPGNLVHPALRHSETEDQTYIQQQQQQQQPVLYSQNAHADTYGNYDRGGYEYQGHYGSEARGPPSPRQTPEQYAQGYGPGHQPPPQSWRLQHQRMSYTPPPPPMNPGAYRAPVRPSLTSSNRSVSAGSPSSASAYASTNTGAGPGYGPTMMSGGVLRGQPASPPRGPVAGSGGAAGPMARAADAAGNAVNAKKDKRRSAGVLKKSNPKDSNRSVSAESNLSGTGYSSGPGAAGGGGYRSPPGSPPMREGFGPASPSQDQDTQAGRKKRLSGFGFFKD